MKLYLQTLNEKNIVFAEDENNNRLYQVNSIADILTFYVQEQKLYTLNCVTIAMKGSHEESELLLNNNTHYYFANLEFQYFYTEEIIKNIKMAVDRFRKTYGLTAVDIARNIVGFKAIEINI